ncbi:MAG: PQQ-binding-like beta-propeller repeat protein, partial [Candidatus Firestonebacteria bacterium]
VPVKEKQEPVWSTALGGAFKTGSIDLSPIPDQGTFGWRYQAGEDEEAVEVVTAPGAALGENIFLPVAEGVKKGLVCLLQAGKQAEVPKEKWNFKTKNGITVSPACYKESVYFVDGKKGDANRYLYRVDIKTGAEKWKYKVEAGVSGKFILKEEFVYIEAEAGVLNCLGAAGQLLWQQKTGNLIESAVYTENILVVGVEQPSKLLALDLKTGVKLWERALEAQIKTGPAIFNNLIYTGTAKGVFCCSLLDGGKKWSSQAGGVETLFAFSKDYLAYINTANYLIVLNSDGGALIARLPKADNTTAPLLSRDDILYLSSGDIMYYNISTKTSRKWMKTVWLGKISSPLIMVDSNVYFATDKRGFICAKKKKGNL